MPESQHRRPLQHWQHGQLHDQVFVEHIKLSNDALGQNESRVELYRKQDFLHRSSQLANYGEWKDLRGGRQSRGLHLGHGCHGTAHGTRPHDSQECQWKMHFPLWLVNESEHVNTIE